MSTYHRSPNHSLGHYETDENTYTFHDVVAADGTVFTVEAATREEAFRAAWQEVDK